MAGESKARVKVYTLHGGEWDDRGTGVAATADKQDGAPMLTVHAEGGDSSLIHAEPIQVGDVYQKQGSTIITWFSPPLKEDVALSFQFPEGCDDIWDQIMSIRNRLRVEENTGGSEDPSSSNSDGKPRSGNAGPSAMNRSTDTEGSSIFAEFPSPNLRTLPELADFLRVLPVYTRELVAAEVLRRDSFLSQLVDTFALCEDVEDYANLRRLNQVCKGLLLLNNRVLWQRMLSDEYFESVIGMLEYDPGMRKKPNYRKYLQEKSRFHEVVPLNADVKKLIHLNYRLGFLKDVVLARLLEDSTFSALSQAIFLNNTEILSGLERDESLLPDLLQAIQDAPQDSSREARLKRVRLFQFLQELISIARAMPVHARNAFFQSMSRHGFFGVFAQALADREFRVRLCAIDSLFVSAACDAALVRAHILAEEKDGDHSALLGVLCERLIAERNDAIKIQIGDTLRCLLDVETMEPNGTEKEDFLNAFYLHPVEKLEKGLQCAGGAPESSGGALADAAASTCAIDQVLELLCSCVAAHGYRIQYFLLRKHVLLSIAKLAHHRDRQVQLGVVRFFRACLAPSSGADFYVKHIVRHDLLGPLLVALVDNFDRNNLLESAILDLLDYIRLGDFRSLVKYVIERHGEKLRPLKKLATVDGLFVKFEQQQEAVETGDDAEVGPAPPGAPSSRAGTASASAAGAWGGRLSAFDDDEHYFSSDSLDEDDAGSASLLPSASSAPATAAAPELAGDVAASSSPEARAASGAVPEMRAFTLSPGRGAPSADSGGAGSADLQLPPKALAARGGGAEDDDDLAAVFGGSAPKRPRISQKITFK